MISRINTNIASINAQRHLSQNDAILNRSMERLSSGSRINRAADDAAGLYISESLRAEFTGLKQVSRNAGQAASMVQTAESGYGEIGNILGRLKGLAVQAQDGTNSDASRVVIQTEASELVAEIERTATRSNYNRIPLLNGTGGPGENGTFTFPMGAETDNNIGITLKSALPSAIPEAEATKVGDINLSTVEGASSAISIINDAINDMNTYRADIGAFQNRLDYAISNTNAAIENTMASGSVIEDADVATEMAEMTGAQMLMQAGTSVLAQANLMPQNALALLS